MASKPAYRISTFYCPLADVQDWVARARPGETRDYAMGPALDQAEPVVRLVADLIRSGEVIPKKGRDAETGKLVHRIERACKVVRHEAPRRIRRDEEWEQTPEGKVFLILVRLSNFNMPLPINADIAARAGLRDKEQARYAITKLEQAGRIRLHRVDGARSIEIVETGRHIRESR